jgi:hypothetical protein
MRTKVVHLLRGLYPSEGLELARAYDLMLRAGVCHAAGVDVLSDVQFSIARSPLKSGGCRLGFAEDMVDAAYVASMVGSWQEMSESIPGLDIILANESSACPRSLREFRDAVTRLHLITNEVDMASLLSVPGRQQVRLQHTLSQPFISLRQREVEQQLCRSDPCGYALFVSGQSREAGAWLQAIPSSPTFTMEGSIFLCPTESLRCVPSSAT